MSLAERIPGEERTIGRSGARTIFWLAAFSFGGTLIAFVLLNRLGLPSQIVIAAVSALAIATTFALAWTTRTMTSFSFFFANRTLGPFSSGMGSTTDLLSGVLIIVFFSTAMAGKMALATALVLGLVFHAALFSASFQRSGVSSLPGLIAWRSQSQAPGYFALITISLMLTALAMAEFRVSRDVLHVLTGLSLEKTVWIILILAALPSLFGGWAGLILVNATLAIWMMICALAPAIAIGLFSPALEIASQLDFSGTPIEPLQLLGTTLLVNELLTNSPLVLFLFVISTSAGFSVMPQALSRLSTTGHSVEAIESVGWTALMVFLLLGALPLSVGLVISMPISSAYSELLRSQPVLQILPYFAILFATLNALAVSLFVLASSAARAANRFRNRNPGEQSVFTTRSGVLVLAAGLAYIPQSYYLPIDQLFFGALMLGAGGLFIPLVAAIWTLSPSSLALSGAIVCGTAVTAYCLSPLATELILSPLFAGALGAVAALTILLIDWIVNALRKHPLPPNSTALYLRRH